MTDATSVSFTLKTTEVNAGSQINLHLFGLGSRSSVVIDTTTDGSVTSGESIAANVVVGAVLSIGDIVGTTSTNGNSELLLYLQKLMKESSSSSEGSLRYAAMRLAGNNDYGCATSCGSECSIRRLKFSLVDTTLTFHSSSSDVLPFQHQSKLIKATCQTDGRITLDYVPDAKGNTIPDFSKVGYRNGEYPLPYVPTIKTVQVIDNENDATERIQSAIDEVSLLPLAISGFRGAVELGEGIFKIGGTIQIAASGVVLRGQGSSNLHGQTTTTLLATSVALSSVQTPHSVLSVGSETRRSEISGSRVSITDAYVPTGTFIIHADTTGFTIGDDIVVERASTESWITSIGMDSIQDCDEPSCHQWHATGYVLSYERRIEAILDGTTLRLNVPIVHPISIAFGGGSIYRTEWSGEGRLTHIGIENIKFDSVYVVGQEDSDENHSWKAVHLAAVEHSFVRSISCWHFGSVCVDATKLSKSITILNCSNFDPVSLITGGRRYSFNVDGLQILVSHCQTRNGRHDYVTGSKIAGPNVFHSTSSVMTHADIGPHHRYATGLLFDQITGGDMRVWNRGKKGSGHGWSGAYTVFWNAIAKSMYTANNEAAIIHVASPPGATNFNVGGVSDLLQGDKFIESPGKHVFPSSLYQAQLSARLGTRYFECLDLRTAPTPTPTAQPPTTQSPSAQPPTTQSPSAQSPSAQPPTAQSPTVQSPTISIEPSSSPSMVPPSSSVVSKIDSSDSTTIVVVVSSIGFFVLAFLLIVHLFRRKREKQLPMADKTEQNEGGDGDNDDNNNADKWKSEVDPTSGEEYYFKDGDERSTWTRPVEMSGNLISGDVEMVMRGHPEQNLEEQ